jgi:hypothetical protein
MREYIDVSHTPPAFVSEGGERGRAWTGVALRGPWGPGVVNSFASGVGASGVVAGVVAYTPQCVCEHEGVSTWRVWGGGQASSYTPPRFCECEGEPGVVWRPGVIIHTPHAFASARECRRGGGGMAAGCRRIHPPRFCEHEGESGVTRRPGVVVHTPHAFASVRECRRAGGGALYTPSTLLRVRGSALHEVSSLEVAQLLLEHGADPAAKDENDQTPLYRAGAEVAQLLLEYGADPTAQDKWVARRPGVVIYAPHTFSRGRGWCVSSARAAKAESPVFFWP